MLIEEVVLGQASLSCEFILRLREWQRSVDCYLDWRFSVQSDYSKGFNLLWNTNGMQQLMPR